MYSLLPRRRHVLIIRVGRKREGESSVCPEIPAERKAATPWRWHRAAPPPSVRGHTKCTSKDQIQAGKSRLFIDIDNLVYLGLCTRPLNYMIRPITCIKALSCLDNVHCLTRVLLRLLVRKYKCKWRTTLARIQFTKPTERHLLEGKV